MFGMENANTNLNSSRDIDFGSFTELHEMRHIWISWEIGVERFEEKLNLNRTPRTLEVSRR